DVRRRHRPGTGHQQLSALASRRIAILLTVFAASFPAMLLADRLGMAALHEVAWLAGISVMLSSALDAAAEQGDAAVRQYLKAIWGFYALLLWGSLGPMLGIITRG
ncbi:MAG TPA: hypothetical protein VKU61_15585, partial [Candidatus Binatia bacterium]|nr:hypothetical protein [Candidatus Binatia bacterium]